MTKGGIERGGRPCSEATLVQLLPASLEFVPQTVQDGGRHLGVNAPVLRQGRPRGCFVWAAFLCVSGLQAPVIVPSTLHVGLSLDTGTWSRCALRTRVSNGIPKAVCSPQQAPWMPAARDLCFAKVSLSAFEDVQI